eukprot:374289_1
MGCTLNLQQDIGETDMIKAHIPKLHQSTFIDRPVYYDALSADLDEEKTSIKVATNNSLKYLPETLISDEIIMNQSTFIDRQEIIMNQSTFIDRNQVLLHQNATNEQRPIWAIEAVNELKTANIEYSHSNINDDQSSNIGELSRIITNDIPQFKSEQDMINEVVRSKKVNEINANDVTFEKQIGNGNFGAVYKAKWEANSVVVKQLNNSTWKEMVAEIMLASSLPTHHNLVTIYGYIQNPFGVVMSYIPGGSVEKYVYRKYKKEHDSIPTIVELIIILRKAANGLKFLHSHGLVHRDIACRNILLGHIVNSVQLCTEVKISDFGLMRVTKDNNCSGKTESKVGPVRWMAPESIQQKEYSMKSDVYMFAMTMYEIFY